MLSTAASYMFSHIAQNEILLCDVHLFFYTNILERRCAWCVQWQVTKIKPNVGNDDNGCNDGNGSERLGLKFLFSRKADFMISAQNSLFICINYIIMFIAKNQPPFTIQLKLFGML